MAKINLNITDLQDEKKELDTFLSRPDAYTDPDYSKKNKRFLELRLILEKGELRESLEAQIVEAKTLTGGNDELAELAKMEIDENTATLERLDVQVGH